MAEVLTAPRTPDGQAFYQSSGLRRAHASSNSLYIGSPALSSSSNSSYIESALHQEKAQSPPSLSIPSPPKLSSPDLSSSSSKSGTIPIIGGTSLESKVANDDDISFPDYGRFYEDSSYAESQSSEEPVGSTTTETTASDSPLPTPTVSDDTALRQEPKEHVDYLSHDWREEDIWSSWRHIVSQRRVYGQRSRLENASWRTWAKSKYHLRTISPETLNWLKESDVTWLYGPLKEAETHPVTSSGYSEPTSRLSKNNSFISKKPILKKRSMSEVMLQKSISTSSLVSQAASAVQAQQVKQSRRAVLQRTQSDFVSSRTNSQAPSRDPMDYFTSRSTSGNSTPCECHPKRHIQFSDRVKECRALEVKEDPEEEDDSDSDTELHRTESSSSSDDGVILMKRMKRPGPKRENKTSRSNSHNGRKMIEILPDTTLKYRTDSPDVSGAQQHHTFGRNWGASGLSPSPSQETLRPARPSSNFLLGSEEPDAEPDTSSSWSFGASNPKSSLGAASPTDEPERSSRRDNFASSRSRSATPAPEDYGLDSNLRRTNSGMLMPYDDDDEDDAMAVGLFGRVSETINTARDIAHVIWNVGWRN
ncbi:protein phosphatase regulator [Elasticomyces elasticus]|nr:protein phosphatase regulator [Elasticomyces elasticus]